MDVLQLLLSIPKTDVSTVAKDGRTELHVAAEHDHSDTVQLLIEVGVDVNRKDRSGAQRQALMEDDRWLLPPSCFFRLHLFVAFDGMLCTGVGDENGRRVCVCVRATLLLQPDFGVFLRWMWLVLRGMQVQVTCNTDF